MKPLYIDDYAIKYMAEQTQGKRPEDVCNFYIRNFVFKNEGYLDHLIQKYHLPARDFLKLDKKIQTMANTGGKVK